MATEYALERKDKEPIGTFEQVQQLILSAFPTTRFYWTVPGAEKLRIAAERGIKMPPELEKVLQTLPSLHEGVYEDDEVLVSFGLGHKEPVMCLYIEPRGDSATLTSQLSALEVGAGGTLVVSGEETNRQRSDD